MSNTRATLTLDVRGNAVKALGAIDRKLDQVAKSASQATSGLGAITFDAAKGAALGAFGAAVGAAVLSFQKLGEVVGSSLSRAVAGSEEATAASARMSAEWERMELTLGRALLGPDGGAALFEGLGQVVATVTAAISANVKSFGGAFEYVIPVIKTVAVVVATMAAAGFTPLALTIDAVVLAATTLYAGFLALKAGARIAEEGLVALSTRLGVTSDEDLAAAQDATKAAAKEFDEFKISSAGATEGLWDLRAGIIGVVDSTGQLIPALDRTAKLLEEKYKAAFKGRQELAAWLDMSPDELEAYAELNQQIRDNTASINAYANLGLEPAKGASAGAAEATVELSEALGLEATALLRVSYAREQATASFISEQQAQEEYNKGLEASLESRADAVRELSDAETAAEVARQQAAEKDKNNQRGEQIASTRDALRGLAGDTATLTANTLTLAASTALAGGAWRAWGRRSLRPWGTCLSRSVRGFWSRGRDSRPCSRATPVVPSRGVPD